MLSAVAKGLIIPCNLNGIIFNIGHDVTVGVMSNVMPNLVRFFISVMFWIAVDFIYDLDKKEVCTESMR